MADRLAPPPLLEDNMTYERWNKEMAIWQGATTLELGKFVNPQKTMDVRQVALRRFKFITPPNAVHKCGPRDFSVDFSMYSMTTAADTRSLIIVKRPIKLCTTAPYVSLSIQFPKHSLIAANRDFIQPKCVSMLHVRVRK